MHTNLTYQPQPTLCYISKTTELGTIQKVAGDKVRIIDGSLGTAKQLRRRLKAAGLENPKTDRGIIVFEDSIPAKTELCRQMFEKDI